MVNEEQSHTSERVFVDVGQSPYYVALQGQRRSEMSSIKILSIMAYDLTNI